MDRADGRRKRPPAPNSGALTLAQDALAAAGRDAYRGSDVPEAPLADRVFILEWRGHDLAQLRSIGSADMFWEIFLVEPRVSGALRDTLVDPEAWRRCEFVARHARTGAVLEVFAAPGPPLRPLTADTWTVVLRGTSRFAPRESLSPSLRARLRALLRRLP